MIELLPGQGVHIPVDAPHWVRNGPVVSVSLNINFHYLDAITPPGRLATNSAPAIILTLIAAERR